MKPELELEIKGIPRANIAPEANTNTGYVGRYSSHASTHCYAVHTSSAEQRLIPSNPFPADRGYNNSAKYKTAWMESRCHEQRRVEHITRPLPHCNIEFDMANNHPAPIPLSE